MPAKAGGADHHTDEDQYGRREGKFPIEALY